MTDIDDFSRRRLRELPKLGDLRWQAQQASLHMLAGMLLAAYSRSDLDLMRQAGMLNGHELSWLARWDRSFTEYAAVGEGRQSDTEHCAHCGEDITRARKVITITVLGVEHRYHEARPPCARAARWRRLPGEGRCQAPAAEVRPIGDAS